MAQNLVSDKSNEITAIPELLKLLNIENCVVRIDAMRAQVAVAEQIVSDNGDYLLSVKGNQKELHDEIKDHFDYALKQLTGSKLNPKNWSVDETVEISHGRDETRETLVCHNLDWMKTEVRQK